MKKLLLILVIISGYTCSSSDDNNPCENLAANGEEVSLNLVNAALAYSLDNSSSNCNAYKDAAQAYVTYSTSILDCLSADDRDELEDEIEVLEAEVASLNCN